MADATRPSDHPTPGSDSGDEPLEAWARGLCPDDAIADLHDLRAEGDLVLRWLSPWAQAVDTAIARYETALRAYPISDDLHQRLAIAAGVSRLYDMVDEFLDAATIT